MQKIIKFEKQDARQQIVRGTVYSPYELDTQGEFMVPEGIAPAAYDFMAKGKTHAVDKNHDGIANGSYVVESYISDGDDNFTKGSWVVGIKVPDPTLWKSIEDGVLTGFSLAGKGVRKAAKLRGKMATLIETLTVDAISLVSKPANKKEFAMLKSADQNVTEVFTELAKAIEKIAVQQNALSKKIEDFAQTRSPEYLSKAEAAVTAETAGKIRYHRARLATLHKSLEKSWAGELMGICEADLRNEISKSEIELHALGYEPEADGLDGRCAFFSRGGTSNFLVDGGAGNLRTDMGIRDADGVAKSEDDIEVENNLKI